MPVAAVAAATCLAAAFASILMGFTANVPLALAPGIAAIPPHLFAAVAGGIGLFIALIGLKNARIVVTSPATSVTLGNLHAPGAALALFGLVVTAALAAWKVRAAILIGILAG